MFCSTVHHHKATEITTTDEFTVAIITMSQNRTAKNYSVQEHILYQQVTLLGH